MSFKLKVLGMGLLAVMATSAFAVMNAGATEPGHFVSEKHHTIVTGVESGANHRLHLIGDFGEGQIGCNKAHYHGTAVGTTVESLTVTPTYEECSTTGSSAVTVTTNGCTYTFTVTKGSTHHPVHLLCPVGKTIEIHHPNCTITVAPQKVENAVDYTTDTIDNKHAITLDVTAKFNTQFHGGICIFLGTNHTGELNGSSTVTGRDTAGNPVAITAT